MLQVESHRRPGRWLRRRHATGPFVCPDGICPVCQVATVFTLVGDQLYADKRRIAATVGKEQEPLLACAAEATISSGFSVAQGYLEWKNTNVTHPDTRFCLSSSNSILALFNATGTPPDCAPVNLNYVPSEYHLP